MTLPLTRAQRLSPGRRHQSFRHQRIFNLEEENRQLRREVKRMQTGDQESVFAAGPLTAILWRYNAPAAPTSGATPSAAKPRNCPATILPPIPLPAPPAPNSSRRLQVHGPVGLVSLAALLRFASPFVKLFVISHPVAEKSTNFLDGDVKVCYGGVRKPIRKKGCFRLRRYVPNPRTCELTLA